MKIIFIAILFLLFAFQITFSQESSKSEEKKYPFISHHLPLNGKPIYSPKPEYPKAAIAANASGAVKVRIVINELGNVEEAKPISGHPLLWAESIKVALATKYEPLLISGKAVKIYSEIVYNFVPKETIQIKENEERLQQLENPKEEKFIKVGVVNKKAITLIKPKYPLEARKARISGTVKVEIVIEPGSGIVISAKAVSGDRLLGKFAEAAALKTRFTHINDVPRNIKIIAYLVYKFHSNGKVKV